MKKAILSLGLFSMMMLFTSFTTTELATVSQKLDQTETGGLYAKKDHKRPDYTNDGKEELQSSKINTESYKILYSAPYEKKID